ncbi:PoNe immunity protein domain-containing protein [Sungkyunkwania multivorans]|uniref:PoNe immunity protein domain-containing protein n=1 Tax=Sungkyunkwania multivorans TaxID=1173618 RepID=A0ABW3D100_9FLAO
MKVRDQLNTYEGYLEIIEKNDGFISKRIDKIKKLQEDEQRGVQNYPKSNEEIICSTYDTLFRYQFSNLVAKYSLGANVTAINKQYHTLLEFIGHAWNKESGYIQMVNMLSIGILLDIDRKQFEKLQALIDEARLEDYLIDLLIKSYNKRRMLSTNFLWRNPYASIEGIVEMSKSDKEEALRKLKDYLKKWYKAIEIKTHESKWNIHTGYWCWEAGALAKILELDDSQLKGEHYYPYDLVHREEAMS